MLTFNTVIFPQMHELTFSKNKNNLNTLNQTYSPATQMANII